MIYVFTAVHDRYKITEKFVDQLLRQTYKDIQLVLVDDGCTDSTADMVRSKMPDAVIIQGDGNLWWGGALHEAYKWTVKNADRNAYAMFANDDSEFDEDYIENALKILEKKERTLLTGYGVSRQTGKVFDGAVDYDYVTTTVKRSGAGTGNCASTRSLFFRIEDFLTVGGFHPVLLPHYGSDYEWTIRACRKHGYTVYCDENLQYLVDEETTGDNFYDKLNRKKLFSKRSMSNPIYKFTMIFLSTPAKLIPKTVGNQLSRVYKKRDIFKTIIKR